MDRTKASIDSWLIIGLLALSVFHAPFADAGSRNRTAATNQAPIVSGTPATAVIVGTAYVFQPIAIDPEGKPLKFSIANKPRWAAFSAASGRLSGTPTVVAAYANITIKASDGKKSSSLPPFTISVNQATRANSPPQIAGAPVAAIAVGQTYYFKPTAADADGDALTFSITGKPAWASFNTSTGALMGAPVVTDAGTYTAISIVTSDGKVSSPLPAFTIVVSAPVNHAPTLVGSPAASAVAGQAYTFAPSGSDADGDVLTYAIANKPAWASFNPMTGALAGVPAEAHAGTYANVVISVSDGHASTALLPFAVAVIVPNRAPVISGVASGNVIVGEPYVFQPATSDADGDRLAFAISNKPSWATFSAATGALTGTPTAAATFSAITIIVSDGMASAALAPFIIKVTGVNHAPEISGTPPAGATVGQPYAFRPTASDSDGDVIKFGVANKPAWAEFDIDSGTFHGTPVETDTGTHGNIVVSVSDGKDSAALAPFTITVTRGATTSVTLNWSAPTLNTDGTALTDLAGYRVFYGTASRSYSITVPVSGAASSSVVIEGLAPGTYYFAIQSVNAVGDTSDYSAEVSKTL